MPMYFVALCLACYLPFCSAVQAKPYRGPQAKKARQEQQQRRAVAGGLYSVQQPAVAAAAVAAPAGAAKAPVDAASRVQNADLASSGGVFAFVERAAKARRRKAPKAAFADVAPEAVTVRLTWVTAALLGSLLVGSAWSLALSRCCEAAGAASASAAAAAEPAPSFVTPAGLMQLEAEEKMSPQEAVISGARAWRATVYADLRWHHWLLLFSTLNLPVLSGVMDVADLGRSPIHDASAASWLLRLLGDPLAGASSALLLGLLSDSRGRRLALLLSLAMGTVGAACATCAELVATAPLLLPLARACLRLGSGGAVAAALAAVVDAAPFRQKRLRVFAVFFALWMLLTTSVHALGHLPVGRRGWQGILGFGCIWSLLTLLGVAALLPETLGTAARGWAPDSRGRVLKNHQFLTLVSCLCLGAAAYACALDNVGRFFQLKYHLDKAAETHVLATIPAAQGVAALLCALLGLRLSPLTLLRLFMGCLLTLSLSLVVRFVIPLELFGAAGAACASRAAATIVVWMVAGAAGAACPCIWALLSEHFAGRAGVFSGALLAAAAAGGRLSFEAAAPPLLARHAAQDAAVGGGAAAPLLLAAALLWVQQLLFWPVLGPTFQPTCQRSFKV